MPNEVLVLSSDEEAPPKAENCRDEVALREVADQIDRLETAAILAEAFASDANDEDQARFAEEGWCLRDQIEGLLGRLDTLEEDSPQLPPIEQSQTVSRPNNSLVGKRAPAQDGDANPQRRPTDQSLAISQPNNSLAEKQAPAQDRPAKKETSTATPLKPTFHRLVAPIAKPNALKSTGKSCSTFVLQSSSSTVASVSDLTTAPGPGKVCQVPVRPRSFTSGEAFQEAHPRPAADNRQIHQRAAQSAGSLSDRPENRRIPEHPLPPKIPPNRPQPTSQSAPCPDSSHPTPSAGVQGQASQVQVPPPFPGRRPTPPVGPPKQPAKAPNKAPPPLNPSRSAVAPPSVQASDNASGRTQPVHIPPPMVPMGPKAVGKNPRPPLQVPGNAQPPRPVDNRPSLPARPLPARPAGQLVPPARQPPGSCEQVSRNGVFSETHPVASAETDSKKPSTVTPRGSAASVRSTPEVPDAPRFRFSSTATANTSSAGSAPGTSAGSSQRRPPISAKATNPGTEGAKGVQSAPVASGPDGGQQHARVVYPRVPPVSVGVQKKETGDSAKEGGIQRTPIKPPSVPSLSVANSQKPSVIVAPQGLSSAAGGAKAAAVRFTSAPPPPPSLLAKPVQPKVSPAEVGKTHQGLPVKARPVQRERPQPTPLQPQSQGSRPVPLPPQLRPPEKLLRSHSSGVLDFKSVPAEDSKLQRRPCEVSQKRPFENSTSVWPDDPPWKARRTEIRRNDAAGSTNVATQKTIPAGMQPPRQPPSLKAREKTVVLKPSILKPTAISSSLAAQVTSKPAPGKPVPGKLVVLKSNAVVTNRQVPQRLRPVSKAALAKKAPDATQSSPSLKRKIIVSSAEGPRKATYSRLRFPKPSGKVTNGTATPFPTGSESGNISVKLLKPNSMLPAPPAGQNAQAKNNGPLAPAQVRQKGRYGVGHQRTDSEGRVFDLNTVVVNFANVACTFTERVTKRPKEHQRPFFDYEGVRRCLKHLSSRGYKVIGVVYQNKRACDGDVDVNDVPKDIQNLCESVELTPCIRGEQHRSADDEMTIKCAYNRNCRFMDNDNYKDWRKNICQTSIRKWLDECQDYLQMRYYFDSGLGIFDTIDGNIL